eukprot:CAMPEP_0119267966 /NCGR_PEP_ID=MMETSP1329-20130426/5910_1 /TAXON_ID=114041 /ORGANISM="Genus nov. species nov., Strain RCC1024" /LENGTH=148 /DNA_ID=CAMNT_0007267909 /DNA_START=43 /DNA_END=486 /DNA_ORIENTATION=-
MKFVFFSAVSLVRSLQFTKSLRIPRPHFRATSNPGDAVHWKSVSEDYAAQAQKLRAEAQALEASLAEDRAALAALRAEDEPTPAPKASPATGPWSLVTRATFGSRPFVVRWTLGDDGDAVGEVEAADGTVAARAAGSWRTVSARPGGE